MKLLNADKLIEFIEANKQINGYTGIPTELLDQILYFISTNSIEVEEIKTPADCAECSLQSCDYENGLSCNYYGVDDPHYYDREKDKWFKKDFCDISAIYIHKADVKTTDKSCPTCEHYSTDVDDEGYPIVLAPCDICGDDMDNWTPKADKVEGEKTNE